MISVLEDKLNKKQMNIHDSKKYKKCNIETRASFSYQVKTAVFLTVYLIC